MYSSHTKKMGFRMALGAVAGMVLPSIALFMNLAQPTEVRIGNNTAIITGFSANLAIFLAYMLINRRDCDPRVVDFGVGTSATSLLAMGTLGMAGLAKMLG